MLLCGGFTPKSTDSVQRTDPLEFCTNAPTFLTMRLCSPALKADADLRLGSLQYSAPMLAKGPRMPWWPKALCI